MCLFLLRYYINLKTSSKAIYYYINLQHENNYITKLYRRLISIKNRTHFLSINRNVTKHWSS